MQTYYVSNRHIHANDNGAGTREEPFLTINHAAQIAMPGDTVIVAKGVYRERVSPANSGENGRRITYKSEEYGKAVIKGSNAFTGVFEPWNNLYRTYLPKEEYGHTFYVQLADSHTIPDHYEDWEESLRPKMVNGQMVYIQTDYPSLTLGQVFVNDENLIEKINMDAVKNSNHSWYFDRQSGILYVNYPDLDSNEDVIELTARNRIFAPYRRGLGYITVEGFTMMHCGNQFPSEFWENPENAQAGALGTRSGHNWIIRNNIIANIKNIGVDIGCECRDVPILEGYPSVPIENIRDHIVENNAFYDCGSCSITGLGHYNSRITGNYIEKSNSLNFSAPEAAGIKLHYCFNADIYDNKIIDSNCDGIWLDNIYTGTKIHHNTIINTSTSGIMLELGAGPVEVFNNYVSGVRKGLYAPDPRGSGIYGHDAEGAYIHDNTITNCEEFGIYMRVVTDRHCGRESDKDQRIMDCAHIVIENNLLLDNIQGQICLPQNGRRSYSNTCRNNIVNGCSKNVITAYDDFSEHDTELFERNLIEMIRYYENKFGKKAEVWENREGKKGILVTQDEWKDYYK